MFLPLKIYRINFVEFEVFEVKTVKKLFYYYVIISGYEREYSMNKTVCMKDQEQAQQGVWTNVVSALLLRFLAFLITLMLSFLALLLTLQLRF